MTTFSEQVLHAKEGTFVDIAVDKAYVHDGTGLQTLIAWRKLERDAPLFPERLSIIFDHIVPPNTGLTADLQNEVRRFAKSHNISFSECGIGICHQVMAEGRVLPAEVVIGADSHSCTLGALGAFATGVGATDMAAIWATGSIWLKVPHTTGIVLSNSFTGGAEPKDLALSCVELLGMDGGTYRALEFTGDGVEHLNIDDRLTIANLAVETGAKTGIFYPDSMTKKYLSEFGIISDTKLSPPLSYESKIEINLEDIEPVIAYPPRVDDVRPVSSLEGLELDQVFIGTCTNGRYSDLFRLSQILKGKEVRVKTIVVPASRKVLEKASSNGVLDILIKSGCMIGVPGCGPCLGVHMGVLGEGEICLSTANRNFKNRMGIGGDIYLSSVSTAAASALAGRITHPEVNNEN